MRQNPLEARSDDPVGRLAVRVLWLVAVGLVGMGLLGLTAMITWDLKGGGWWSTDYEDPIDLLLSGGIGMVVGFISLPIVVPCLMRTNLRWSIPAVYGFGFAVVVCFVLANRLISFGPLPAAIPGLLSVCAGSFLAWTIAVAMRRRRSRSLCEACGYDLRGSPERCPECGKAIGGVGEEAPC